MKVTRIGTFILEFGIFLLVYMLTEDENTRKITFFVIVGLSIVNFILTVLNFRKIKTDKLEIINNVSVLIGSLAILVCAVLRTGKNELILINVGKLVMYTVLIVGFVVEGLRKRKAKKGN